MSRPRIGIFGGTFDPIHIGHLAVAERACDELGISRILFVPAIRPPHKPHRIISSIEDRLAMLELAIEGNSRFGWSDVDLRPDQPSFTVDMLTNMTHRYPDVDLDFIVGADSLRDFDNWYKPREILELARLVVADRPGVEIDEGIFARLPALVGRVVRFDAPLLEVSSTSLRQRVREGKSIRYLVPSQVFHYVENNCLYQGDTGSPDPAEPGDGGNTV